MCARKSNIRRIVEVAALEGAAAFGSVWLAQFRARTGIDSVMVGEIKVPLPKLTGEGVADELTDPRLAIMAIHECACINPKAAAALKAEWEARGRELG